MKAKLLLMLFFISLGMTAFSSEKNERRKRVYLNTISEKRSPMKRSPSKPFAQVEDINDCLYITFHWLLENADITIKDKDGNEVVSEQQILIYEGHTISIPQSDGYPYSIEIVSPTVEIQGEIVLEE